MDPLGNVVREFMRRQRDDIVKTASALVGELQSEGMDRSQIEEMLFASGFETDVVAEALDSIPSQRE